ncbi:MAG TPA: response regulator transcription factor [Solirubrobacterales bacterium]|nr:response regulator transcription factor [Solirubrobacterales bacterium]
MSLFVSSPGLAVPATRRTGVAEPAGIGAERQPTVAIYHDQALSRAALAALLHENGIDVVAAAAIDVEDVLSGPEGDAPDVALVSVSGQGIAMAHRLGRERRSRVLLKLVAPPDGDRLLAVAATGASGAVCRQCPPDRVLRAIRAVAAGGMFFECLHQPSAAPPPPPILSDRERAVALELARGAGSEEIAEALCISPHTARTHVRNIKRKLGARTLAQAVALAITMGLVIPPGASA